MDVLDIRGLTKTYGRGPSAVRANDGIDLRVAAGSVVCLLGHNGAGKSTLVGQIVGLLMPDAGSVTLAGIDAVDHPDQARELACVQAQTNAPISGLTPRKGIELVARMRGASRAAARARAQELLTALDLHDWADKPAEKVSGGVARLTSFAMTIAVPAPLVVLDEPTNDVDPVRRRLMWQQIRQVADGAGAVGRPDAADPASAAAGHGSAAAADHASTAAAGHGGPAAGHGGPAAGHVGSAVLLVTHNVHEAEAVVDDVVLLDAGRVVVRGTPADLRAQTGTDSLEAAYIHLVGHAAERAEGGMAA